LTAVLSDFDRSLVRAVPGVRTDTGVFIDVLRFHRDFFEATEPIVIARAPGRLDVMGGIADYSGALVLELPLADATFAAVQRSNDSCVTVRSLSVDAFALYLEANGELARDPAGAPVSVSLGDLHRDYAEARALLTSDPKRRWAAYVIGTLIVLRRERGVKLERGLRILIGSQVPSGKGVASSAALEVAAMRAVCAALDIDIEGRELALLCQMVENHVVGAPCGVMDQMTAACGTESELLALLCQPAELLEPVRLPDHLAVWGIDSDVRHEIGGASYGGVRTGAFMGYRIIAEIAGLSVHSKEAGVVQVDDRQWGGYLANLAPAEWEERFRDHVPVSMRGSDFLERYAGITDTATRIEPNRVYAVRQPTAHPIYEHHRVRLFQSLLRSGARSDETCVLLGELMRQSHASYGDCGLGSNGTDRLVALVDEAGTGNGLFGAKITGGGNGGVVAVLGRADARSSVEAVAARYAAESGRRAVILEGSSSGAMRFGVQRITL
jgi:L-arabinokinase